MESNWSRVAVSTAIVAIGSIAALTMALDGCGQSKRAAMTQRAPIVGQPAPDFSLQLLDGHTVSLADYRGKTLVLNVWGSWCPPCRSETPDLVAESQTTASENVAFLGVDTTESVAIVSAFVAAKAVPYPQAVTSRTSGFVRDYHITNFPTTILIDPTGVVRAIHLDNRLPQSQLHKYIEDARFERNAMLVTPEQARLDAMLSPNRYRFEPPASVHRSAVAASAAIDNADSELEDAMNDASRDHDYAKTKSEEQALRLRTISALKHSASTVADREMMARMQGDALAYDGRWQAADAAYARALAISPRGVDALGGRSYTASELHDFWRAVVYDREIALISPSPETYVSLGLDAAAAHEPQASREAFERAVSRAMTAGKGRVALHRLAWTELYFGRAAVKLGDKQLARRRFADALAVAQQLPKSDENYAMLTEEAQEATVALDVDASTDGLSIAPWTGPELPGAVKSTSKFRLVVSGTPGKKIELRASGLRAGWIGSFCSDRVCSPFRASIAIPSSGVKIVEFQLVPGQGTATNSRARIDSLDRGRIVASVFALLARADGLQLFERFAKNSG